MTTADRAARANARTSADFPPAPEPLPYPVLDSHTHLDIVSAEGDDPVGQIAAAAAVGVDRLVQVGVDVASSRWGVELANTQRAVLATVALHPNEAPRLSDLDGALKSIEELAEDPRVRGIGETGLDFFRTGENGLSAQERSFRAHIGLAKRVGKPLVIHDRDAHADILRVLDDEGAPQTVVMHCFSGDAAFAAECCRRGFVLSFAGTVTFKNAPHLREAAALAPIGQVLVETDAPYLTPMPHRGRPNASYLIPLTVRALAEAKGVPLAEMCQAISANGDRIFGPW
ncbi:AraC family transcriptional regulator [Catellatospora sp. TT07R-123]|uniref:TatD family hydrolase n=1 Tax=Catellatospora sp. TT07R-123 TaxID=2733863 RepID=UPI001B1B462E|nr:TatD family hydrolase [Catellatospora sp. TT07R-123]GHJ50378.1 AraC family transcriptional regulator [Catellatospora sp. TT07R-123]